MKVCASKVWLSGCLAALQVLCTAIAGEPGTLLERDNRLKKTITILPGPSATARIFSAVGEKTAIRLYTKEDELRAAGMVAGCDRVSAASLMDATAALWLARWKKDDRSNYEMLPSQLEENHNLPQNRFETDRAAMGNQFAKDLASLPPRTRAALRSGVPVSALPPTLVRTIARLTESVNTQQQEKGDDNPFPLSQLGSSAVKLEVSNRGSYNSYFITLSLPGWGSMGWRFSDETRKPEALITDPNLYTPAKFEIKHPDAKKQPLMQRRVSVSVTGTLPQVLVDLCKTYRVPFVCSPERSLQQRARVRIQDETLAEALDQLVQIYKGCEWEYRRLGFIVVRSADNPARRYDPAKGADDQP